MVWRIRQIDHVDDAQSGVEQWNVIIGDGSPALLDEDSAIAHVGSRLPHPRHDFRYLLE